MSERERLSLPQQLVRKFPRGVRIGLAGIVGAGSLGLAACGPGRGGEVQSPAAAAQAAELPSPTAAPTEAPKPTIEAVSNEQGLNGLNSLIDLIQNPDSQLIATCNPQPHLLQQDQELIVYGDRELPDPNKYQEQKFTKPGLVDVRDSLTQGDRAKASEQLTTLWRQVTNSVGCFDSSGKPSTEKKDRIFWNPEQVNTLDVQRKFIPSTAVVGWYVSKIKEEAAKQFLKLWYGLTVK